MTKYRLRREEDHFANGITVSGNIDVNRKCYLLEPVGNGVYSGSGITIELPPNEQRRLGFPLEDKNPASNNSGRNYANNAASSYLKATHPKITDSGELRIRLKKYNPALNEINSSGLRY